MTNRDKRRLSRQEQYQQRQQARQRERQRQLRIQQVRRGILVGAGVLIVIVAIALVSVFVFHVGGSPSKGKHTLVAPTYMQDEFFDGWGQPMRATQPGARTANPQRMVAYESIGAAGSFSTIPPELGQIAPVHHAAIVALVANPSVHLTAQAIWLS